MKSQVIINPTILIASMVVLISNIIHFDLLSEAQTSNTAGINITLPELYTKVQKSVVDITDFNITQSDEDIGPPSGSGFIYDTIGNIITTTAVVSDIQDLEVKFWDGSVYRADVVGLDPFSDIAVIRVQDAPRNLLVPLSIGNSSDLQVGDQVITVSSPFDISGLLAEGIIGKLGGLMPSEEEGETTAPSFSIPDIIVTDVPTNPGSAGGPLLSLKNNQVIGMNAAVFSSTGEFAGVSFAIPSNTIRKVVPSLIESGSYAHPWLGISGIDVTRAVTQAMGLTEPRGFLVTDISPRSPAGMAGIIEGNITTTLSGEELNLGGDIITAIDNQSVREIGDILGYMAREKNVGDEVKLAFIRDNQPGQINVTLGSRPSLEEIIEEEEDLPSFENNSYGITIQYPANWTKDEEDLDPTDPITNIVTFSAPFDSRLDQYSENFGISIENLTDTNMTLEEYADSLIANYNETLTDFKLIESNTNSTLGGSNPAYRLVYSDREDDTSYRTMEVGTIIGDKVYFIEYIAEEENYSDYLPIVYTMVDSLEIIK
jgi:S1-C subfamily serine protease